MDFAELKDVPLREVWEHEAHDFTRWLASAENLARLSEAIGIHPSLEPLGSEVQVGPFAADIVASKPADGSRVLIENQLEGSDHTHLGQILTYLAGVEAQTVVWVAREFRDEHRSVIRWLNDHTVEPFEFFAVRVRVVRIADSPRALVFEVLEHPSAWDRRVRATVARPRSEWTAFYRDFWAYYAKQYPDYGIRAVYGVSSLWVRIEAAKLILSAYLARNNVGVCVRGGRGEAAEAVLQRLQPYERSLRDQLGVEIGDTTAAGNYASSFYSCNTRESDNWPDMAEWLHTTITNYRQVLEEAPEIKRHAEQGHTAADLLASRVDTPTPPSGD